MAATLVVEMDGDLPGYARVHAAGCRDCHDPEPLGDTLADVAANWPWPEEVDADFIAPLMPCAAKALK